MKSFCQAAIFLSLLAFSIQYEYKTEYFDAQLDHFSFVNNKTFKLRYLINDTWWDPSSPTSSIFFYTGNEGTITGFAENSGLLWEFAPSFNALVVFAEHRYYGDSLPFGNLSYSSPEYSGYLSSSQALADFIDLIAQLKINYPKSSNQHTPVIAFGGSYGGMLSAWIRMKYPGVITGALAASAPIWQFTNMAPCDTFDKVLTSAFVTSGSNLCVKTIKKSWGAIDYLGKTEQGRAALNNIFKPCTPITNPDGAVQLKYWLSDMYGEMGMGNYPYPANFIVPLPGNPVKEFCRRIKTNAKRDKVLLRSLFQGVSLYFNYTGTAKCLDLNMDATLDLGTLGWSYQSCTEMVMPSCDKGDNMFEKSSWDINAVSDACYEQFKVRPIVDYVEKMYGGKNISSSSNIIFSNGLLDPWSGYGVLTNISETSIAVILPGAAHHLDLRGSNPNDPPSVVEARKLYFKIFEQWVQETL